ncbi:hypothetical protein [Sphingobacterium hungaricum]|uniref:Uncharacterized protein n=1 Tax=Sphingobacterium hungaricum TaxID=2082723 RepID=A0A928V2G8_9SPHI|nr:hypothetical protein [Sphingobacterium hungaricum]MBE8715419.1 hypothetical protein [Sphingobacterium hungaricum]
MKINILTIIILLFSSLQSFSQIYDSDQAHSNIQWKQINSPHFKLIFPSTFENSATALSYQLDAIIKKASEELDIQPRKIAIILQSNHVNPNGYVQLAPRKSEFYTTPPSTPDNIEWLPNLALHEMRHVAQFDKLTGRLKRPFLELLALGLFGLNLPAWFFEGDAVYTETAYSTGGRGRLSSWDMPLRTNMISNKNYTFDKYILGSYKDIVPSFYTIGYFLNTQIENTKGPTVKADILNNMRHHLIRPYNFNKALKKYTGYTSNSLFRSTIDSLRTVWVDSLIQETNHYVEIAKGRYPINYLIPQENASGELFALMTSPEKTSQIVKIENGKARRITYTGQQVNPYFQVKENFVLWDEYRRNARFAKQTHQIINIYNYKTKKLQSISHDKRYYTPIMHPNESQVAVINVSLDNYVSVDFIDITSETVVNSIDLPEGMQALQPNFNKQGDKIVLIVIDQRGTNLMEIDLQNNQQTLLLPWENQQLERPVYADNNIVYKANYNGKDQLFLFDRLSESISPITNDQFGAFNPTLTSENSILYNAYQYDGYYVAKTALKPYENAIIALKNFNNQIDQPIENPIQIDSSFRPEITKYNSLSDFFNFHSLTVSNTNFESFDNYRPGLYWQANDLLNTSQLKVGYEYDLERQKSIYSTEISYQKYYPKFTLRYENRGQIGQAGVVGRPDTTINFDWREHYVSAEVSIPFTKFRRNYTYSYGINTGTSYTKRYNLSLSTLRDFNMDIRFPIYHQVYLNRNSLRSKMDLAPKWGQNINIIYRYLPFEEQVNGEMFSVLTNFYFPGIVNNHSFQVRFAFQEFSGDYQYSYDIPLVSGFGHFVSPKVTNTMMLNYRLPIAYPDWALGSFSYLKRIQGLIFTDYQNIENSSFQPKSMGIGLSLDFNLFRYALPEFNVGSRLTYINDASATQKIVPTFSFSYSY